jgi:crotonobetainyl-CoA:carnitine CoA-transferase CaiB-like acyl-CoA transferase
MGQGPLAGIRVLDISHNLAGPLTGMHLGDLGAEVVKLERPAGDEWRGHELVPGHPGRSRHYLQANRNKRSVAVDLTDARGQEIAHALVRAADVLVTNLRPGVPERLAVDWTTCQALNDRLVYCQISAFGDVGPRREERGYDIVIEALGGFMPPSATTDADPVPRPSPIPINDTGMPLLACTGILAALLERERSGRGQHVELSLLGMAVALNAHSLVRLEDHPDTVMAFPRAFYRVYRTADGWIAIAAYAERLAHFLCAVLGLPGVLDDERFATKAQRFAHNEDLVALFAPRFAAKPNAHWVQTLGEAGVPCAPVRERDELFDDPQVAATGLLTTVDDAELGPVTMISPAARLSRTPGAIRFPGRHLGADTREVLTELGYDAAAVAALEQAGVIVATEPRRAEVP